MVLTCTLKVGTRTGVVALAFVCRAGASPAVQPEQAEQDLRQVMDSGLIALLAGAEEEALRVRRLLDELGARQRVGEEPTGALARSRKAKAAFEHAEEKFQQYVAIRIEGRSKLAHVLRAKTNAGARLDEEYRKIIELGDPVFAVAALVRHAMIRTEFAKAILSAESPSRHDGSARVSALGGGPFPLDYLAPGRARLVFALETASSLGIENEWTALARTELATLPTPTTRSPALP